MHRILLKIKIPYFLKAIFGFFPFGLGIAFGVVGLLFLFLGPKWILKEDEEAASKSKKAEITLKQKMWLKFTFWAGIIFVIIGIGSVAVALLDNSDLEEAAKIMHEKAINAIDSNITNPTAQQAYDLLVNPETKEWDRDSQAYNNFKQAINEVQMTPTWANDQSQAYRNTYSVNVCREFQQYLGSLDKIEFESFEDKFNDFKQVPVHAPLKTIEVPSYGVMVMLGFLAAILIAYGRAKQYGIDPNIIIDLGIIIMIAAIVGARLWYVIEYWNLQMQPEGTTFWAGLKKVFMIQQGGLVFYGGMILAMISSVVYLKYIKKQPTLLYFDFMAILIPLGHAFGRTGCFLNGCCYGQHCDASNILAVAYPGNAQMGITNPVYATQMLAAFTNVLIFILLTVYYETLAKKRGETFFMYFVLYGTSRFISHLLRGDVDHYPFFLGMTSSQFLSVILFVVGLIGVVFFRFFNEKGKPAHLAGIGDAGPFKRIKLAELDK